VVRDFLKVLAYRLVLVVPVDRAFLGLVGVVVVVEEEEEVAVEEEEGKVRGHPME